MDFTPKITFFLWLCNSEAVLTKIVLWLRKCSPSLQFPICSLESKTVEHMLVLCQWAWSTWADNLLNLIIDKSHFSRIEAWMASSITAFISCVDMSD